LLLYHTARCHESKRLRGIGRVVAHGLVDAGCRVVVGDADQEGVERVATELEGNAKPVVCRVESKSQVKALMKAALKLAF